MGLASGVICCVRGSKFSVLVNGSPLIYDGVVISISLCSEVFFNMLCSMVERGGLNGIEIYMQTPSVCHILFADGCLLFSKALLSECRAIKLACKAE